MGDRMTAAFARGWAEGRERSATAARAIADAERIRILEDALLAVADELADENRNSEAVYVIQRILGRPSPVAALVSTTVRQGVAAAAAEIRRRRIS